jgi:hypothetical protein
MEDLWKRPSGGFEIARIDRQIGVERCPPSGPSPPLAIPAPPLRSSYSRPRWHARFECVHAPLRRPGLDLHRALACYNINYQLRFRDRYASKRPCAEFRCQCPAEGTKFRCREGRQNYTQAIDLQWIFDVAKGFLEGEEEFLPAVRDMRRGGTAPLSATGRAAPEPGRRGRCGTRQRRRSRGG